MPPALAAGWVDLLAGRISTPPGTRVLEASLEWRSSWPTELLAALLVLAAAAVLLLLRRLRAELSRPWRMSLAALRIAALAVPLVILFQPHVAAHLERSEPRLYTVLLDRSGSMTVEDGPETPAPRSRWARAVDALQEGLSRLGQAGEAEPEEPARAPPYPPQIPALPDAHDTDSVAGTSAFTLLAFAEDAAPTSAVQLAEQTPPDAVHRTAIAAALRAVHGASAGRPPAGVILVSDGAENVAEPADVLAAARAMHAAGIPIHACMTGSEQPRDISVELITETPLAFPEDPVRVRVQVSHQGYSGRMAWLSLHVGERLAAGREVTLPAEDRPATELFDVQFEEAGRHTVRAEVAPLPGELTPLNNQAAGDIVVMEQPLRVLYVERWPRWQYHFLGNALRRDSRRCDPSIVLLMEDPATPLEERRTAAFPNTLEELAAFDVVILGDVDPRDLSSQQWEWLHEHVSENGAGVILIAGPMYMPAAFMETPIAPLLPFERSRPVLDTELRAFDVALTPLGATHALMRLEDAPDPAAAWRRLPPLLWHASVADLKPGAAVLAQRPADAGGLPTPLVVLQRVGRGLSLFVGTDETWRWRYEVGNRYFYGFWGRAIQHVGLPHRSGEFHTIRIQPPPRPVAPRSPFAVTVAVHSTQAGITETGADALTLIAAPASGTSPHGAFPLERSPDAPFIFQGRLQLAHPGRYRLFVEGFEDQGEAAVEVTAGGEADIEMAEPRVNANLLRGLAEITGGTFMTVEYLPEFLQQLDLAPITYRWTQSVPLWDNSLVLMLLALLLATEWVLRKWKHLP